MANDLATDELEQLPPARVTPPPAPAPATPATKDPTADDYARMFAEQDGGRKQQLRSSLVQSQDETPDRAADVIRLSRQTGIPQDVVGRNYDEIRKHTAIEQAPLTEMVRDTPALATWAADPKNAAVSHDDMDKMGALEWLVSMPSRAISQALNEQAYGELRTKSIFEPLTQEEHDRLAAYKLHAQMGGELGSGQSWFRGALTKTMKLLTTLTAPEAIPTAAGALAVGSAGFLAAGPAGAIAGAKLGAEAGYTYGLGSSAFKTAAGAAYDDFLETTDALGRKLDPEVAKALAVTSGAINAGLMLGGGKLIASGIDAAGGKVASMLTRDAIKAAIRQPSVAGAIAEMVKGYGVTLTEGTALMVAMKTNDILMHALATSSGERAPVAGMQEPGNVDLFKQPAVQNADGSISTVDSLSVNIDGKEVLLPTVTPDGRHLSQEAALEEFKKTGRHMGKFDSPEAATAFAKQVHEDYAAGKYTTPTIGQQLLAAAEEGVQSFAIIGATGPALGLVREFRNARRAQQGVEFFKALGEGVEQSKTAKRLPEAAQEFLATATKDGPIPTLYTSIEDWTKYWQEHEVDPREMAAHVTGDPDAYDNALKTGEDMAIPTARYATKLAATEHNAHFADELRLGPEEMNGRESKALIEKMAQAPDQPAAEAGSPIYQAALEQLTKGGGLSEDTASQYASLVDSAFGSMAQRAGVDPLELYRQYGLTVDRPDLPPDEGQNTPPAAAGGAPGAPAPAEGQPGLVDAAGRPLGGYAGPERRQAADAAGELMRRRTGDTPLPAMASIVDAAAQMRRENPNIDKEAQANRERALAAGRIPEPDALKGRGKGLVDNNADAAQNPENYLNVETRPASPAEEGHGPADAQGQQPGADVVGHGEGRGDGNVAEPGRTPPRRGIPELDEVFVKEPKEATAARLTPEVERNLRWILEELDNFKYTPATWHWLTDENASRGKSGNAAGGNADKRAAVGGAPVYDDVIGYSPVNTKTVKGEKVPADRANGSRAQVQAAIEKLLETGHVTSNLMEGALRVAEARNAGGWKNLERPMIPPPWGEPVTREFTDSLSEAIDQAQQPANMLEEAGFEQDAVESGDAGDTSFDPTKFYQSLFDELEPPDPKVDTLTETGEQQPRLPGDVGDVREQDVKTPEFEAPFSLTSEIAKPKGKQTTLFQSPKELEEGRARVAELEAASTDEAMGVEFPEDEPSHFPDGSEAVVCTNCAEQIIAKFGGEVFGWEEGTNPTSVVAGPTHGARLDDGQGHDFAIVDGRYLVDPWAVNVEGSSTRAAFDLLNPDDRLEVARLYGDPNTWMRRTADGWVKEMPPALQPKASAKLTPENVAAWAKEVKQRAGRDLQGFSIVLTPEGDLFLESLIVDRGAQRAGLGTKAMLELTRFADLNGKRITLTPAHPGDIGPGEPTSTGRLVKFYKRFGFVENKGRHLDPALDEAMYREPTAIPGRELEAPAPKDPRELIIQHNLTAANLLKAGELGGLPVPSLAITKAADAMTNFGEVTLLGKKEMADPKGYARTRVFGSDVYSPRYPTIHYKIDAAAEKRLGAIVKAEQEATDRNYFDLDSLQKEGPKALEDEPAVMAAFLRKEGVELPKPAMRKDGTGVDSSATRYNLRDLIDVSDERRQAFKEFAAETFKSLQPKEQIYRGFTNMGNRSYQPHTLDNVVKILKKDLRGGESSSNIYGVGQLRSKFAPQFRSLKGIIDAKNLLVDDATFETVKKDVEGELFKVVDQVKPYYTENADRFGFVDTVMAVMEESPKKGISGALKSYGFEDVPDDVKQAIAGYIQKLRTLPTEYFEAKILREVDLAEFGAAVIPDNLKPEARQLLESRGVQLEEYKAGDELDRKRAIADVSKQLADTLMFQPLKRGAIRFGPDRQFNIDLLERADLSTFLHESGHFFLEVFGDLADQVGNLPLEQLTEAQRHLLSDYGTLLQALGVERREDVQTGQHEEFARMFEAYLREGKAPSLALQTPFARFRAWLLSIYDSLKKLNINLTPEVRGVMDRMLATDHAIAEAEQQRGVSAMFTTPESAGMEPREFELYARTVADAHREAQERLDAKLLREVFREQTREWKARREEVKTAVENDVHRRPEYGAIEAMRKGTHPNGEPLVEGLITPPLQLSRKILEERFGAERIKRLPRGIVGSDGGLDPDVVAGMFGYASADAMLTAVEKAPAMRDVIERETKRRMIEEHGSILLDGSLHNQAQAAVANATHDEVIRAEMRALGRLRRTVDPFVKAERAAGRATLEQEKAERAYERRWFEAEAKLRIAVAEGKKQGEIDELTRQVRDLKARARGGAAVIRNAIPDAATLRDAASARINAMRIGDIQPATFWSASRRAGQQALEKAARQDFDGAIAAKQQELINLNLYRQAEQALEDVDDRVRFAKSLGTPAARKLFGLAGQNYLDQVDGILERFEFAKVSQKVLDRRGSLQAFVAGLEAQGLPVDIPEELLDESRRRNYKQLTVEELRGVTDGLKELQHLARLKNRLLRAAEKRELEAVTGSVADAIREHFTGTPATQVERDRRVSNERARMIGDFFASHRKMASLAREMDGFADGGQVWEQLIRPLNEAADREADMVAAATKKFGDIIEQAYPRSQKRLLYEKLEVPAVGQSLSRMERLSIALNWGNEGNRDRVRRGEGWTDSQVQAILDTLDKRDLTFVQATLDAINAYWPEIAAKQERVYGIAPEKVESTEIRAKAGTIAGGYFPLKYDDRADPKAGAHLDLEAGNLARAAAYAQSTTKRGHTKERVSNVKMPLRRDFGVIFEHVNQVIHDLTHHEALIDVNRVLSHPTVQKAIYETHGDLVYRQFKNGVRDVAFGQVPAVNAFERAIGHVRTGATVAGLGWSLSTAMLHLSSALPRAVVRIGPEYVARGIARWTRDAVHMENTAKWIDEQSTMMRNRSRTQQREINELRNQVGVNTGKFSGWIADIVDKTSLGLVGKQGLVDSYFYLVQQAQRIADIPTWLGQYEKSMAAGVSEKDAIAHADQAVLDAFGGGQNKDLASVQRGGPLLRLWTNFYSPFNVTYNLTVEANRRARFNDPGSIGRLAVDYLMLYSVPATMGMLIHGALKANPKQSANDEDASTIAAELLKGHAAYAADTMLGFRELSGAIEGYYGYEGPAGARLFASVGRVISQTEHSAAKLHEGKPEEAFGRSFWLSLNDAGGVIFHYPSGQAGRTIDGIAALIEGKTSNPGALIVGAPKK